MNHTEAVCWHCFDVLDAGPPHCERCPPFDECDVDGCDEPGCTGQSVAAHPLDELFSVARMQWDSLTHSELTPGGKSRLDELRRVIGELAEVLGQEPPEVECDHPWHRNTGLIAPCPACGAGGENG